MSNKEKSFTIVKSRLSILAFVSLFFSVLGLAVIFLRLAFYRPWWSEYVARNIILFSGIAGLITGLISTYKISRNKDRTIYCKIIKNSGIALSTFLVLFWWMETCGPVSTALRMACASNNLARISRTISTYSEDNNGRYPEPNKWCDLLLQYDQLDKNHFLCPGIKFQWKRKVLPWPIPKNYECYYAMNPNCEPNSPPDMVLLFETDGGWNKFGGPELLTTKNHRGEGSNVLFHNGRVDFISTKKLGDLKWE